MKINFKKGDKEKETFTVKELGARLEDLYKTTKCVIGEHKFENYKVVINWYDGTDFMYMIDSEGMFLISIDDLDSLEYDYNFENIVFRLEDEDEIRLDVTI